MANKTRKQTQPKEKRRRNRETTGGQTKKPFEQDSKRRIGQFGGAGEPPLMKK